MISNNPSNAYFGSAQLENHKPFLHFQPETESAARPESEYGDSGIVANLSTFTKTSNEMCLAQPKRTIRLTHTKPNRPTIRWAGRQRRR